MLYPIYTLPVLASLLSLSSCQISTSTFSASPSNPSTSLSVSTDGSCGSGTSFLCLGSRWGDCCSPKGWCGGDAAYCGAGCQPSFGNCTASSSSPSSGTSSTKSISTDGSCGGFTGSICLGSTFGDCCSEKGYCGGNASYCAAGCQSDFGHCGSDDTSTNETAQISTDGSCGGSVGTTCLGSTFGDCCSLKGYCGGNSSYCDAGCQRGFGTCAPLPTTSAPASSSSSPSQTSTLTPSAAAATTSPTSSVVPIIRTTAFKAGMAVASVLSFLALLSLALLLFFFLLRRRRRQQRRQIQARNTSLFPPKSGDAEAVEAPSDSGAGGGVGETPPPGSAKGHPSELATVRYCQELEAGEKMVAVRGE